jgi:hypothetical protein
MNKYLSTLFILLSLIAFSGCAGEDLYEPVATQEPASNNMGTPNLTIIVDDNPALTPSVTDPPNVSDSLVSNDDNLTSDPDFTIEQIQTALQSQFQMNDWGEGNPQVISVERVERDRDSMTFEGDPNAAPIDLSNSYRYRVAVRFKQSLEAYNMWFDIYSSFETNPYSRDGDYTILTDYYYFNNVNGIPVLVFVMS